MIRSPFLANFLGLLKRRELRPAAFLIFLLRIAVGWTSTLFADLIFAVRHLRVVVAVLIIYALLFYFPTQRLELISTLGEETPGLHRTFRTIAMLLIFCSLLTVCSFSLLHRAVLRLPEIAVSQRIAAEQRRFFFIPMFLGWSPWFLSLWIAIKDLPDNSPNGSIGGLSKLFVVGIGVVLAMLGIWLISIIGKWCFNLAAMERKGGIRLPPQRMVAYFVLTPIAIAIIVAGLVWYEVRDPLELGLKFGPLFVLLAALSFLLILLSIVDEVGERYGVPLVTMISVILIPAALFFAPTKPELEFGSENQFLWGDVRVNAANAGSASAFPTPSQDFEAWLSNLKERLPPDGKTKVFLVTAQGGGIIAGYHTALTLARLQDRCPQFADHIYAMSGVSGGSIGLAVFLSSVELVRTLKNRAETNLKHTLDTDKMACSSLTYKGLHERLVERFFEFDLLTPLILRGAIVDIWSDIGAFLGFGYPPDRASSLEQTIRYAWMRATNDVLLDAKGKRFAFRPDKNGGVKLDQIGTDQMTAWRAAAATLSDELAKRKDSALTLDAPLCAVPQAALKDGQENGCKTLRPIILFNTTIVETGEPMVISQIRLERQSPVISRLHNMHGVHSSRDLSIVRAAVASARFPLVAPPAIVSNEHRNRNGLPKRIRVVDGGYFENSGAHTIGELLTQFCAVANNRANDQTLDRSCVENIEKYYSVRLHILTFTDMVPDPYRWRQLSEISSPVAGLLNARAVRGFEYVRELQLIRNDFVSTFHLSNSGYRSVLAWLMSKATRDKVDILSGGSLDGLDNVNGINGDQKRAFRIAAKSNATAIESILNLLSQDH